MQRRFGKFLSVMALALAFGIGAADLADAKPKTNFGSRGSRTYDAPAATQTAPTAAAPIQRSTTPNQPGFGQSQPGLAGQAAQAARPGFMSGWGGTLLKGLAIGGLLGLLFGHGFGGLAGMMGMLFQVALIGLAIFFVMRLFRRNQSASNPAMASANPQTYGQQHAAYDAAPAGRFGGGGAVPSFGGRGPAAPNGMGPGDEIGITKADLDSFERLISSVWTSFGREDEGALRGLATPEIASYLGEELMNNRTRGVRNEMSDVRLLQGDVSEAWREAGSEYATVAVRYSLKDVTRDRATGRVVEGDADHAVESRELWTFVRTPGDSWKVSAIQDA